MTQIHLKIIYLLNRKYKSYESQLYSIQTIEQHAEFKSYRQAGGNHIELWHG